MSEWQEIESAPKDGTVLLGYDSDEGGGISMGVVVIYWWDADEDDPEQYPAEWRVHEIGTGDEIERANITHWMPLPEPPK